MIEFGAATCESRVDQPPRLLGDMGRQRACPQSLRVEMHTDGKTRPLEPSLYIRCVKRIDFSLISNQR